MHKLRIFVDLPASRDIRELLETATRGHQLVFPTTPASSVLAGGEPDPQFATTDIAFGQPEPAAIAEAPCLKWVHISSSGITRYDNPQFRALMAERKIAVTNSASVYNDACAVHALSFMLAQTRKLPLALKTRAASGTDAWWAVRGTSGTLKGETILIVGFGAIGMRLAELLRPFDMKIVAYRRKARGDEGVRVVTPAQLTHVLGGADHVMNILPDNVETRYFFDAARFAEFKSGAVFYNIGRGTTVSQDALVDVLRSGRLKAAWLDVTEPEPLPGGHPLWAEPNCFITPHVAGGHVDETKTLVLHFLKNFERFLRGQELLDRVM